MSTIRPTPRSRPVTSAHPKSPRIEETHGYRRGRAIRSCLECRRRKMRCNRSRPCQNCNRFCRDCVYLPFPEWPSGASNNLKVENDAKSPDQAGGRALASFYANHNHNNHNHNHNNHNNNNNNNSTSLVQTPPFTHHNHDFDTDPPIKQEDIYEIDVDDQPLEVGLQIGRLSITENINGFFSPHVASQISTLLSQTDHIAPPYNPRSAYGISSTQHQAQRAAPPTFVLVKQIIPLEPSHGLLTTASRSFLPQPGLELPTYKELDLLYCQYWNAVDPLAHILHKPSFDGQCVRYMPHWQVIEAAPASFKALLLAMCLAAAVSLPLGQAEERLGVTQQTLVGRFKVATEKALIDASFMSSVAIQTLQAFTIYLIPQCRAEISKSHAVYVGALIRLAMDAGLNRDPSSPEMNPVECQVRRLLWHQICFLDLVTAEAQGPQPAIREDQFDTHLPLNIKDESLDRLDNESFPASGWTEATFSIIRYECCRVHRIICEQRSAIARGQTDLKTAQHLVSTMKSRIERQYLHHLDESDPIQRCAKLVGRLFTARFDAILLHRHSQFDMNTEMQPDIREKLIESCLTVCECAAALDTDPGLAPWAWYARAHHQYERSIFLLMEVHRDPFGPHANRINMVLDHVFGVTPNLCNRDRSRKLLELLAEEFNKMTPMRKIKTSQSGMSDNGSSSPNDLSGMVSTPEDSQHWNQWRPGVGYGHVYSNELPPMNGDAWWPIPVQHGMHCDLSVPHHDEYTGPQHDEFGYSMGSGPA